MNPIPLRLKREGAIAHIVFNRSDRLDAIDVHTAIAFDRACELLEQDPGVRVVVIRADHQPVGAGDDAHTPSRPPEPGARTETMHRGLMRLTRMAAPVLASLQGCVSGASYSLAMACDLAVASDDTCFHMAHGQMAARADAGASWHLPRLVGLRKAMEIALMGPTLSAKEAKTWGLVNWVVPTDELEAATDALAESLASAPTAAMGRLKRLLHVASHNDLPTQLNLEREGFLESVGTADFPEAIHAFFDRRAPRFLRH